jgi:hypothetical protein
VKFAEMRERVVSSFAPIELVTDEEALDVCIEQSIAWWDRVCAYTVVEEFAYNQQNVIQLPTRVDQVIEVLPDRVTTELFTAQTLLLGVTILDYDINTLVMKHDHLANLRTFLGSRFRWRWVKPYLYIDGMTTAVAAFAIFYLPHYDFTSRTEEITDKAAYWITRYAIGLVKQKEGRILRLGKVIGSDLDGDSLYSEGISEVENTDKEWHRVKPSPMPFRSP